MSSAGVRARRPAARGSVGTLAVIIAACVLSAFAGPARAADRPRSLSQTLTGSAKADFEAAKLLANDGDFAGALIKFQSAYDASKDPRILWNVAFCHKNLRHYAKVTAILRRYLAEGGALLSPGDRKDAQELIVAIDPFTTRATFRVSQPGAQIFVDEELIGTSPLGSPAVLDLGERRVRVTKEGYLPFEKTFGVVGGPELTIDVALALEVHEGTLIIEAPPGAAVFIDDKQVGVGRVEKTIASGGHQLRVTAATMRPFQSEVVVRDHETRSVSVLLEAQAATEKRLPTLRLAVGCADPEPKGPEDGLTVSADGLDALPAGFLKKAWSDRTGRSVLERAEYSIAPGRHRLRIGINDCEPSAVDVDVDPVAGASVAGALASSGLSLLRGPQGMPGTWRAGFGLWLGAGSANYSLPETYGAGGPAVAGAVIDLGLVGRWFGLFLDASYAGGPLARRTFNSTDPLPSSVHANWEQLVLRAGPRLPLRRVSFGLGAIGGFQHIEVSDLHASRTAFAFGAYAEIDLQPLCDWGLFYTASLLNQADGGGGYSRNQMRDTGPSATFQLGFFYEPNARCRIERGALGLWQSEAAGPMGSQLDQPAAQHARENAARAWRNDGVITMVAGAFLVGLGVSNGLIARSIAHDVSAQYDSSKAAAGPIEEKVGIVLDVAGAAAALAGGVMVVHGWRLGAEPPAARLDLHVADAGHREVAP